MATREQFEIPRRNNSIALALMAIGILSIIGLLITNGLSGDEHVSARFWASFLQNFVYFLLITNAAMFFICATTLAWGGWQMAFRRVSEAISTCVPVLGIITFIILMVLVFGPNHAIYEWADNNVVAHDEVLQHKSGFLNKGFFTVWTIITIAGWSWLGYRMRQLSRSIDAAPLTVAEGKRFIWTNTVW